MGDADRPRQYTPESRLAAGAYFLSLVVSAFGATRVPLAYAAWFRRIALEGASPAAGPTAREYAAASGAVLPWVALGLALCAFGTALSVRWTRRGGRARTSAGGWAVLLSGAAVLSVAHCTMSDVLRVSGQAAHTGLSALGVDPEALEALGQGVALDVLGAEPAALFVFTNKRRNLLKLLWFDRNGYCILYKRLHGGARLRLPERTMDGVPGARLDGRMLGTILQGVEKERRRALRS